MLMGVEVEAKLKVDTHEAVRRRLGELGGRHVSRAVEVDTFYDWPDAQLLAKDQGLRVRQVMSEAGSPITASTVPALTVSPSYT